MQAGVESYSIKRLVPLCGYRRQVELAFPRKRLVKFCTKRFRGDVLDLEASAITIRADKGASQERGGKRRTAKNQRAPLIRPFSEVSLAISVTARSCSQRRVRSLPARIVVARRRTTRRQRAAGVTDGQQTAGGGR
jgi:hypothetical protein